jgi:hypothetical protein
MTDRSRISAFVGSSMIIVGFFAIAAEPGFSQAPDVFQSAPGPVAPKPKPRPQAPPPAAAPSLPEPAAVPPPAAPAAPPSANPFKGMLSSPFDGSWSVVVACAQAPDGAKAYRWNFTALVRDGSLLGQYNQPGNIPSGTLSGQILPTGNAHLTMTGLTGDPDYNLRRVPAGFPIHYTVTAQFMARFGTGSRDQARHCDLTFSKI